MLLTPAQRTIVQDRHRFRVVCAGRRVGKTTLAGFEMVGKAVSGDDKRIAYIAPTYKQARDIAWQELKKIAKPIIISINEARLEITVKTKGGGKSIIWLRGWESVESLRGQKFDFIVIDEVAMMRNFWSSWHEVIRPTLTDRKGEVLFISTPRGFNHFYDLYNLEGKDEDYKSFHFTSYDNPHLPVEELEKAKKELNEDRFHQEYMADFRKQTGLVYKEFDRSRHIIDDFTNKGTINSVISGVDFGYKNPAAIVKIEKNYDGVYYVVSEWYKREKTTEEIVEYAASLKANKYYPDPAEPDRIDMMKKAGLNVQEVNKDIVSGVDAVRNLIKQNRLFIHKDCVNLISEIESYSYPDKRSEGNENETPIKEDDHLMDALRYALFMDSQMSFAPDDEEEVFNLYSETYQ